MYADHVPQLSRAMREDYQAFRNAITFAVLSMRQPITSLPAQMADVRRHGANSPRLFGHKREAYMHVLTHGPAIWEDFKAARTAEDAIVSLLDIPGLGIVKAAFVAQMFGWNVACLDSRNIAREGLNPRKYCTGTMKRDGRWQKLATLVNDYVRETGGRAAELWDTWCADAGDYYGRTALEISEIHLLVIPRDYVPQPEVPF